jgi:purine-binding chemotaxis protein CheW
MMVEVKTRPEKPAEPVATDDMLQVLMFRAGAMLICIDVQYVQRTISLVALQAMPGSAAYVAGIMNLARSSVPVIDLAIRIGLPSSPYTLDTPIMVCVHGQQCIGVIVQDIIGIQTLHGQDRQLTSEFSRYGAAFCASAHTEHGMALLLDAAWLIRSELYQGAPPGRADKPG